MGQRHKALLIPTTIILLIVAALAILGWLAARGFSGTTETKQHLPRIDWLPIEASDISFARNDGGIFPWLSFECSLPNAAFATFAEQKGWKPTWKTNYSTGLEQRSNSRHCVLWRVGRWISTPWHSFTRSARGTGVASR